MEIEQSPKAHDDKVAELPLKGNLERTIRISKFIPEDFKENLSKLFHEFEDVFA